MLWAISMTECAVEEGATHTSIAVLEWMNKLEPGMSQSGAQHADTDPV
jgi:hypothetical protein